MKLCTFAVRTPLGVARRVGVVTPDGIVDATAARVAWLERGLTLPAAQRVASAQVPAEMIALIGSGGVALEWVAEAVAAVSERGLEATSDGQCIVYAPGAVTLLAPVPQPPAMVNFSVWPAHSTGAADLGISLAPNTADAAVKPYWKGNPSAVVGPDTVLECPSYADELDVECELVCVVGTGGRDLDRDSAARAIVGYTILNDLSARERQAAEMATGRGPSKGKDFDHGNPMGPWIVTSDEIGDPRRLQLSLHINGKEMSSCSAAGMLWDFPEMLSYLSVGQTVPPGLVISGGCYAGGSAHEVGVRLRPGDRVEMRVSGIGGLASIIGGHRGAPAHG